jgi:hypothetical protein
MIAAEAMNLVSAFVRAEVRERFGASDAAEIIEALDTTPLPLLDGDHRKRGRARVHLAVLKLADGDIERFREAFALARLDWRDVLVAAGLANADWPSVLQKSGWRVR